METEHSSYKNDFENQYKPLKEPSSILLNHCEPLAEEAFFTKKSFLKETNDYHYYKKEVPEIDDKNKELDELLRMDFPKRKDGKPDGRRKEYRKLLQLANDSPFPINLDGFRDMRFTNDPDVLKLKLAKIMSQR